MKPSGRSLIFSTIDECEVIRRVSVYVWYGRPVEEGVICRKEADGEGEFHHHDAIRNATQRNATPMFVFVLFLSFIVLLPVTLLRLLFLELRDALFLYHSSCQYTWTRRLVFREYNLLRMTLDQL
jgi:hypothetical protein